MFTLLSIQKRVWLKIFIGCRESSLYIDLYYSEPSAQISSGFLDRQTASTLVFLIGSFSDKYSNCQYVTRACGTKIEHKLLHWVLSRRLTISPRLLGFSEKLQWRCTILQNRSPVIIYVLRERLGDLKHSLPKSAVSSIIPTVLALKQNRLFCHEQKVHWHDTEHEID